MKALRNRVGVFFIVFLLCCGGVVLTSCATPTQATGTSASQDSTPVNTSETWAIYWYLCGSNLETDYECATEDIAEMLAVTLPENVEVIIQTGGSKTWHNGVDASKRQIYHYSSDGYELVDTWSQANMGAQATLVEFLNYCNTNYPADKRMLLFWDHGGGSLSGVCNDENYRMDALTLPELQRALAATSQTSDGTPLYEMVGFDACLMASLDTAAIFAPYANFMVASEEIEPLDGWDYTGMFNAFVNDTDINGDGLGRAVCDSFADFYNKSSSLGDKYIYTLSVIDLRKLGPLLEAYDRLGDEALYNASNDPQYLGAYGRAAMEASNFTNGSSSGYTNMMDLGDFVTIGQKAGLFPKYGSDVLKALDDCVIYKVSGSMHKRAKGLSCFYNYAGTEQKLKIFLDIGTSRSFNYFYEYVLKGTLSVEAVDYVKQISSSLFGQNITPTNIDQTTLAVLEGFPLVLGSNGQWQLDIGPELGQQLAAVYMTQAWVSDVIDPGDESFLGLYGLTGYFPHNFTTGVFTANFQNDWFALGNLPLYTEPYGWDETSDMYSSPVLINGEQYSLIIAQNTSTGKLSLLGAVPPIDLETGQAGKEVYQLKDGDIVEAIMYVLLPEGTFDAITGTRLFDMPLGQITYDSSTVINMRPVSFTKPGEWATFMVSFAMEDYAGNVYFSGYGYYQASDGKVQAITGR